MGASRERFWSFTLVKRTRARSLGRIRSSTMGGGILEIAIDNWPSSWCVPHEAFVDRWQSPLELYQNNSMLALPDFA
jgi:hypothetical protein